jgi:hypothetical protein
MNIFICCDGTWNTKENPDNDTGDSCPTNVRWFFLALRKGPVQPFDNFSEFSEVQDEQVAYYSRGVGTGGWDSIRGGGTGLGMGKRIRSAYRFLMNQVKDPKTDRIFLVGFSRGAFTARALAGMVKHCGLLIPQDMHADKSNIRKVYKCYRKDRLLSESLERTTRRAIKIHFVGVWDTVGAVGFPLWGRQYHITGTRIPRDTQATGLVTHAYHAVAMDEQRASFSVDLWRKENGSPESLEQIWFRGVHADVGGGYPERGLANKTLKWMVDKASTAGAAFDDAMLDSAMKPSPAVLHDSLRGLLALGGSRPRAASLAEDPNASGYNPSLGYLHEDVVKQPTAYSPADGRGQPLVFLSKVGDFATVDVHARLLWNTTGIVLEKGSRYLLAAEGSWKDASRVIDPDGEARPWYWWPAGTRLRAKQARWFELIGYIPPAEPTKLKTEPLWRAFVYLFEGGTEDIANKQFRIGKSLTYSPSHTGVLSCFANDLWLFYGNNSGTLRLTVTRVP